MIVLDTNVISELMKSSPSTQVLDWIDQQKVIQLFITTVTIAEIGYGLAALPDGKKRKYLEDAFNKTLQESFANRILAFNESAAHAYGKIMGKRKKLGRPLSVLDGQIAAICVTNKANIATRNKKDFANCDIEVINPFL